MAKEEKTVAVMRMIFTYIERVKDTERGTENILFLGIHEEEEFWKHRFQEVMKILLLFPFLLPDNDNKVCFADKNQGRLLHNECIKVRYVDPGHLDEAAG